MAVQRQFKNEFRRKPPQVNNIRRWFEQFKKIEKIIWKTCSYGSPGLTGSESFLWEHIKNTAYAENTRDLPHLQERICAAVETVSPEMLSRVWEKAEYSLDICRATYGAHIEIY